MGIPQVSTEEKVTGGSKLMNLLCKIIAFLFAAFSSLNVLFVIIKRSNRSDFNLFGKSMLVWLLFLVIALAVFLFLLLLIRKPLSRISERKAICYAVIIMAVIVPRLLVISVFTVSPTDDFKFYHTIAQELAKGNVTGSGYISLFPHTFGYPAILSLVYSVFGPQFWAGQMLNILSGIGIAILLHQIGSILFNRRIGLSAALFWAIWPSQVLYALLLSTEAIFTFLMLLTVRVFLAITKNGKPLIAAFAGLGLLCAFTNCIRPFGIVLILTYCIVLILGGKYDRGRVFREILKRTVPCLVLAVSYFISSHYFGLGLSRIIQKETASFPVGFNLLTGSNIKYYGVWNMEDSQILYSYTDGDFDAQEVQNTVMDIAIQRYMDQGTQNLFLFYQKYNILWASDDDVLNYMKAGTNQNPEAAALFSGVSRYLKLACNLYYLAMTCLFLLFAIHFCRYGYDVRVHTILLFILGTAAGHLLVEVAGRYHYPVISLFALLAGAGFEIARSRLGTCRIIPEKLRQSFDQ